MWENLEEFEAICKDGIIYLVQSFRYPVPFKTFSGETKTQITTKYLIDGVKEVVALSNGDFMIKETGVVLRRHGSVPPIIT